MSVDRGSRKPRWRIGARWYSKNSRKNGEGPRLAWSRGSVNPTAAASAHIRRTVEVGGQRSTRSHVLYLYKIYETRCFKPSSHFLTVLAVAGVDRFVGGARWRVHDGRAVRALVLRVRVHLPTNVCSTRSIVITADARQTPGSLIVIEFNKSAVRALVLRVRVHLPTNVCSTRSDLCVRVYLPITCVSIYPAAVPALVPIWVKTAKPDIPLYCRW
jgi:hypothetical protein